MVPTPDADTSLRSQLVRDGRTRWLDIGSGGNLENGFDYLDLLPEGVIDPALRGRYHRLDIVRSPEQYINDLGQYDLVRLQHTLEHFSWEDGTTVLKRCAMLLKPGALLVATVPDLRVHIARYQSRTYKHSSGFAAWAHKRIPKDAPSSFYFSVYAHSTSFEPHLWCYDAEGLVYLVETAGFYDRIEILNVEDPRSSIPFTHNRPDEDLCVLARRLDSNN